MKKKTNPDLKSLWEKATKKRNVDSSSIPEVATVPTVESQAPFQSDSPSVPMQLQPDVAVTELGISITNVVEAVASNEPEGAAEAASSEPEEQNQQAQNLL